MPQNSSPQLAVLVSGGVDSSVARQLLHAAGHSYTAFYLKIWFQQQISSFSCFILRWSCTISQNEMQSKQKDLELEDNALIFVGGKVSVDILLLMKLLSFAVGVLPDHVPKELADIIPRDTLLWKLKLLKSAVAYANSHIIRVFTS
ncbi:hypothetical protein JHK85_009886 [Glycine max]|nr:hypothetical protein JHK85_009886 [Glycine max]